MGGRGELAISGVDGGGINYPRFKALNGDSIVFRDRLSEDQPG